MEPAKDSQPAEAAQAKAKRYDPSHNISSTDESSSQGSRKRSFSQQEQIKSGNLSEPTSSSNRGSSPSISSETGSGGSSSAAHEDTIKLVKSFIATLKRGTRKEVEPAELLRRKKLRKREINRASAKRKRIRVKQEREILSKECQALEDTNEKIREDNERLAMIIRQETEKRNAYLLQIALMQRQRALQPAAAKAPAHQTVAPAGAQSNALLQNLVTLLQQVQQQQKQKEDEERKKREQQEQLEMLRQLIQQQQARPAQAPVPFSSNQTSANALLEALGGLVNARPPARPPAPQPAAVAPGPSAALGQLLRQLTSGPAAAPLAPAPSPPPAPTANNDDSTNALLALLALAMNGKGNSPA